MAYLYRHIRLDKNVPFYIGIGKDKYYYRAYTKNCRNSHWRSVVKKSEYDVEVLFWDIDYNMAKIKEKEFISLYGRSDLGIGTLVNQTDGGDGNTNWSEDQKNKFKKSRKGKKLPPDTGAKISKALKGRKVSPAALENMKKANQGKIISKETREKMAARLRGRPLSEKMKKMLIDISTGRPSTWSYSPITQFGKDGILIKEYPSITHAAKELKLQNGNIYKVLVGKRNHCGGFIFKYKNK